MNDEEARETGRLVSHVLLDTVSAWDGSAPEEVNAKAMDLAWQRLNDVGAVSGTIDEDAVVTVEATPLLGGTIVPMSWLVSLAAELGKTSRENIIVRLREFVDGPLNEPS